MRQTIVGWDIGGAHLKMAQLDAEGSLTDIRIAPCPLWRGIEELDRVFTQILNGPSQASCHAVTMTGELVDCFDDRQAGVRAVLQSACRRFDPSELMIFAAPGTFLSPSEAMARTDCVASANWLATAQFLAKRGDGLLVDVGSTTTDLVPLLGGKVAAMGFNDTARLSGDELVYTGITRTPVMAVADKVPFDGNWVRPMAELFATMADVYRLTGALSEEADLHPAADGGAKTLDGSARRLLRMVGTDLDTESVAKARQLAEYLSEMQLGIIYRAASRVISASGNPHHLPVIGLGTGRFVAMRLSVRMGLPYRDGGEELTESASLQERAAAAAPAVAVARLAFDSLRAKGTC